MKLTEESIAFINFCSRNGKPVNTSAWFNNTYLIEGKNCKFTKEVWQQVKDSGLVKVIHENEKFATFGGYSVQ